MCTALLSAVAGGLHHWGTVATERLIVNGLKLAAIAVLAGMDQLSVGSCVAVLAITPVVGAIVYVPGLVQRARSAPATSATPAVDHRALLSYGGRVWLGTLSGVVLSRIDQVLMAPLAGTTESGSTSSPSV